MWLRDWIGPYLESKGIKSRVLIYGYEAKTVGSISNDSVHGIAKQFLELLRVVRKEKVGAQPPLISDSNSCKCRKVVR
jgi:hypothetical protein